MLPPSEGKAVGGVGAWDPGSGRFGTGLGAARIELVEVLGGLSSEQLGVAGSVGVRAVAANGSLIGGPVLPAWARYTGVVYQHLDPQSLSDDQLQVARSSIVILSGLGGVVAYNDPLPDYRASFGKRAGDLGVLGSWWAGRLGEALAGLDGPVIDLLPGVHRACVERAGCERIVVDLYDESGARGSHNAKAAKGLLVRALLSDGVGALSIWRSGGWSARVVA